MKTSIKLMSVAIAVYGFVSTAHAQSGITSDPYWSQFVPKENTMTLAVATRNGVEADAYWSQFLPKENTIALAANNPGSPTVDSYWSQFVPWEHKNA